MKRVGLIVKHGAPAGGEATRLGGWLRDRGCEVFMDQPVLEPSDRSNCFKPSSLVPEDAELLVVLGGDGTLLYAARTAGRTGVPMLGVNLGALGFLTEIAMADLYPMMERVLAGDYTVEKRMMLSAEVIRGGRPVAAHTVLNDAVINKGALARIMNLAVSVDGMPLTTYRADGLIISTPTGSTAYNLSAGGPIVHPAHESIILSPICPFTLTNRPLILPTSAVIAARVDPEASDVILTSDGQVSCPLEAGDMVVIQRSEFVISLIKNPYKNYFEILRTKLRWG